MKIFPKKYHYFFLSLSSFFIFTCNSNSGTDTIIRWDTYGIPHIKAENKVVNYIGRKPAASPATGYLKKHLAQQKEIIEKVLS